MSQFAQRLRLDLPDAFARDIELFADLFQRAAPAVRQTKAQSQHLALAFRQSAEHLFHGLAQQLEGRRVRRRLAAFVWNEVAEVTVFFVADWSLQRDGRL